MPKAEWKDVSTRYKGDPANPEPGIVELAIPGITRIVVHRHIHYPKDQWLLSATPFFDKFELDYKDLEDAKREAIKRVRMAFESALEQLKELT